MSRPRPTTWAHYNTGIPGDPRLTPPDRKHAISPLEAALEAARRGYRVLLTCWPDSDSPEACACPGKHGGRDIGKAPFYGHGYLDATCDPETVRKLWARYPGANVGLWLEGSGLAAVDPDSAHAGAEAHRLGMLPGPIRHSKNTAYLYALPEGCPIERAIHEGEDGHLDVLSEGYLVIFGRHKDGHRVWTDWSRPPRPLMPWAVEMLERRAAEREATAGPAGEPGQPSALSEDEMAERIKGWEWRDGRASSLWESGALELVGACLCAPRHEGRERTKCPFKPYDSESERELGLMNIIRFWGGPDPARMERLFSRSAPGQRPKWRRAASYRRATIRKALRGEVWSPAGNSANKTDSANASAPWEPPMPFTELDRPPFPTRTLGGWLREWVEAEAEATQTPPDLAGLLSQAAVSAACAKKAVVRVRDGWTEPLNTYVVVSLPSGERKTRVFSDATAPLEAFEEEEASRIGPEVAEAESRRKIAEKALERAQAEAAKAKDERLGLTMEADRLARELASMKIPVLPRLIVDDCSPERLAALLRDRDGRIAAMSPEGDIFDLMAGRYSANGSPNFGVFLKAHAGDTLRVDRVGRPPEYVKEPALTLGLAVQPEVIRGLASKPGFRGRGLLARLNYSLPRSILGSRNTKAPPVPPSVRAAYEQHVLALLKLPMGTDPDGNPAPHVLTLSAGAREALEQFEAEVEPRLGELGDLGHMTDWGGKLVGAVARCAGRLHLAAVAGHPVPWEVPIGAETMRAAIEMGRYLTAHAKAAFADMGADPVVEDARYMLRWIAQRGGDAFTKREAFEGTKGRFKKVEALEPALALLADHLYIRECPGPDHQGPGRRPSPTYDVNPLWSSQNSQYSHNSNCANTANSANGRAGSESAASGEWEEGAV